MTPGRRSHERQQLTRGSFGVPQLDAEHHHIDRPDGLRVVGRVDFGQMERIRPPLDREAVLAHSGKMRSARDEMNIGAPVHEPRAEVTADPSRPHNGNSQRALRSANARSILCPRRLLNLRGMPL